MIFLVDDNTTNLASAEETLSEDYRVISLTSAAKMFDAFDRFIPDLILLDIEMPEMNGFEAMQKLKDSKLYDKIPVIFLTGRSDVASETAGIELGAVDFITKPFTAAVLKVRVKNHLNIDQIIRERTAKLTRLQNGIVSVMADLVENRDGNTGGHIDRTAVYMEMLVEAMIKSGIYIEETKNWDLKSVALSARLHDLGKIAIPDSVLNKPGKLNAEEFNVIKGHSEKGAKIIDETILKTGDADFLRDAKIIASYHHEKWNGTGYPHGLKGLEIPLLGRIMALVDVYDALVSERPYKKAFTHEQALTIIKNDSGTHFDPEIVNVFMGINEGISKVHDEFVAHEHH